ncbi:copper chaperone PCu(A)C [Actinoplanes sp. NPDC051494]|uniref:copper chaperone PCu(A)C n=1 Tax=Actinoplanes sp. NPDC051494 TaxID=3363907 RepID=UPI0037B27ACE
MRNLRILAAITLAAVALTGCGDSKTEAAPSSPSSAPATLTVKDPWVKAGPAGTMTAAFGILENASAADLTVVSATSPASPLELHEMTMQDGKMIMRPKQGGFVIKAGATHELGPGGDHLMLMNPAAAIEPGDEVTFTLTLADGATVPFTAIAKPFAGAGESYAPDMPMSSADSSADSSAMPMAPADTSAMPMAPADTSAMPMGSPTP